MHLPVSESFLEQGCRFLWIWTILLIFISCSSNEYVKNDDLATEPTIQKYFDRFETVGLSYGMEIDLESKHIYGIFSDLDEDKIGNCRYRINEPRRVAINRKHWESVSDLEREYIIFHELGHCFLEREHDDRQDKNGQCLSIMHSAEGRCWLNYNNLTRDAYLKELFTF